MTDGLESATKGFSDIVRTEETYLAMHFYNAILVKTNIRGREVRGYLYLNNHKSQENQR